MDINAVLVGFIPGRGTSDATEFQQKFVREKTQLYESYVFVDLQNIF